MFPDLFPGFGFATLQKSPIWHGWRSKSYQPLHAYHPIDKLDKPGWLGSRFVDCRIEPDLDAVPALQVERDALWARLNAAGFLTDEERRRMAGVGA